ncbi:unnamed protein product [Rotaria sordida]|uniref:C2H2-type domain-containing protein n=1 Tax=Rotaria sordida TaxID=392033 RepID=A0A819IPP6_9BILA|nr:unnamed protein product [Rotaria sordida]
MCPLYFCSLCQNHQPFTSFVTLYKHIRSIHRNDIPFNIRCTLNSACDSVYTTFESYRSHLNRYHHDLLNDYNIPSYYNVNGNQQSPSLLLSNANIIQDEEDQCIAVQDNSDVDELEMLERTRLSENGIDWPLFTSLIDEEDDMEQFTLNKFEKYYTRFLLDLREEPLKIKLNDQDDCGYYVPIQQSIKNLLNKPDVISYLVDNLNDNITQTKNDPDLMLTYRDGTAAKDNPSLKLYPNSFLIQLYSDGIGITNPIGPKKDEHKLTLYYFVLEDLPDLVRSMLQSIGLVGICPTKYLSLQTNRIKYFEPIVKDLNYLQTTRLAVQTFNGQLHFGFSLLAADNLAAHEIGGFQRNFNSGQFCRLCHISYQFRLTSLTDISFLPRTITTHNAYVQEAANSFNTRTIAGVVGDSPLSDLIGFHPIKSLPRDVMHDFAEGSASQKLCLFKLMPIIFYDIIDQLTNTLDIYTCLHEIISYTRQDSEDPGYLIFSP